MNIDYSYTAVAVFVPPPEREEIADCSRALEEKCKAWYRKIESSEGLRDASCLGYQTNG
jgi:hypothetical protein